MIPSLPVIRLEVVADESPTCPPGFLRLVRRRLIAHYADGSQSAPFVYDEVDRVAIDAVVIAAHYVGSDGADWVYLRSAVRPPLVMRDRGRSPLPELDPTTSIWELPAGLIERGEQTLAGVRACAARELEEELGFVARPEQLADLGPSVFPVPAVLAERHFFFSVEVEPGARREPSLDGSALEHGGAVTSLPLAEALAMCRRGEIVDSKTELGLRRLVDAISEVRNAR